MKTGLLLLTNGEDAMRDEQRQQVPLPMTPRLLCTAPQSIRPLSCGRPATDVRSSSAGYTCGCVSYRQLNTERELLATMRDNAACAATSRIVQTAPEPMRGCVVERVPGLRIIYDVMTCQEELKAMRELAADTTSQPAGNIHAASQWGWTFHSCRCMLDESRDRLSPVPEWMIDLVERAREADPERCCMPADCDWGAGVQHALLNVYAPGDGIRAHVDDRSFWTRWVLGLSLGTSVIMRFDNDKSCEHELISIPPRSLYVLTDCARYQWSHSIERHMHDIVDGIPVARGFRASITMRGINDKWLPHSRAFTRDE